MVNMLHSGSQWPVNSSPVPSPAVQRKVEMPAIRVMKFFTKYKEPLTPQPDAPLVLNEEHWVEWVRLGEGGGGSTCNEAIKRLMPRPERNQPARLEWMVIGPAYEAWKKGEETPLNGQALYTWAGASRELADLLKQHNILTVEDLAAYPDHKLQNIPIPGLREIRNRAKVTVEMRDNTEIALEVARRDEVIATMQAQAAQTAATVAALSATIEAMKQVQGSVAAQITASMPHPDDEYVERGSGDRPAGTMRAQEFQRRAPIDHIDRALGEVQGIHEVGDDEPTD